MPVTKRTGCPSVLDMLVTRRTCCPSSGDNMLVANRVCCPTSPTIQYAGDRGHNALALDTREQAGTASNRVHGRLTV